MRCWRPLTQSLHESQSGSGFWKQLATHTENDAISNTLTPASARISSVESILQLNHPVAAGPAVHSTSWALAPRRETPDNCAVHAPGGARICTATGQCVRAAELRRQPVASAVASHGICEHTPMPISLWVLIRLQTSSCAVRTHPDNLTGGARS